jgi:hypothetical protein
MEAQSRRETPRGKEEPEAKEEEKDLPLPNPACAAVVAATRNKSCWLLFF